MEDVKELLDKGIPNLSVTQDQSKISEYVQRQIQILRTKRKKKACFIIIMITTWAEGGAAGGANCWDAIPDLEARKESQKIKNLERDLANPDQISCRKAPAIDR